ncbi:MAG: hypothetical protein GAK29_01774 [Acinetobacter bereziniae]|uniref:Uncharacterized protein n=1 Tax=Acinetobacter bereziniae TaxID=106648 RepID=A0A833UDA2_ACIBZ|nr:MAG: hypothetical protein GAK29_01774 [Acinetobacter bereziniae]
MLISTPTYAIQVDECKIIEETADMIMQLRQGGIDLKSSIDLKEQLSELQNNLLQIMIVDAEAVPVYATDLGKQKAIDEFVEDWKRSCVESPDGVS